MAQKKIAVFVGSLRKESFSRKMAKRSLPEGDKTQVTSKKYLKLTTENRQPPPMICGGDN